MASMAPTRFKYASSASASPGACQSFAGSPQHHVQHRRGGKETHLSPLKSEGVDHSLHAVNHPMRFPVYLDAALPCRTFGTVEHKEREEGCREELCKPKEHEL